MSDIASKVPATRSDKAPVFQLTLAELFCTMLFAGAIDILAVQFHPFLLEVPSILFSETAFIAGGSIGIFLFDTRKSSNRLPSYWKVIIFELLVIGTFFSRLPLENLQWQIENINSAASCCKSYAEAQEIYRRSAINTDQSHYYASSLKALADAGLITGKFARADINGDNPRPFRGYYFKILTSQGSSALGGAKTYLVGGKLVLGYALLAFPAKDGIMDSSNSFMINNNGIVFQACFFTDTQRKVESIREFDPNRRDWSEAE